MHPRVTIENHREVLLEFTLHSYGRDALDEAWLHFVPIISQNPAFEPVPHHMQIFLPFLFHHWKPNEYSEVHNRRLVHKSPTTAFLEREGRNISSEAREYLRRCLDAPFSYYSVTEVDRGHSVHVRDMLTCARHVVHDESVASRVKCGDLIFGMVVRGSGNKVFEAISPCIFTPLMRLDVLWTVGTQGGCWAPIRRRTLIAKNAVHTHHWYDVNAIVAGVPRDSTDEPTRIVYDVASPTAAFKALTFLARGWSPTEVFRRARTNRSGEIVAAEIPRVYASRSRRPVLSFVTAVLTISDHQLLVDVRSPEEAEELRLEIQLLLGENAIHRDTLVSTADEHFAKYASVPFLQPLTVAEHALMNEYPTPSLERMARYATREEDWLDTPQKTLEGKTPREAAVEPAYRERVASLINAHEAMNLKLPRETQPWVYDALRKALNL